MQVINKLAFMLPSVMGQVYYRFSPFEIYKLNTKCNSRPSGVFNLTKKCHSGFACG